jgi:hypothetical protein
MEGITLGGRPVFIDGPPSRPGLAAPPRGQQGLGATSGAATSPATVGLVAALGGGIGLLIGGGLGAEIAGGYGEVAQRRAAIVGVVGMLAGAFAGAALAAPSVQQQTG